MKKWIFRVLLLLFIIILLGFIFLVYPKLPIINGYVAKRACSSIFISGRSVESLHLEDFNTFPQSIASIKVSEEDLTVSAYSLGLSEVVSVYRPGLGCKLLIGEDNHQLNYKAPSTPFLKSTDTLPWPYGIKDVTPDISEDQIQKLQSALSEAFDKGDAWEKKTRAMLVMKNGQLLAEKYRAPYNRETPFLGWSMTKSVTNILIGILIKEGKLNVDQTDLFEEWAHDDRKNISLDNLMRMNSGLQWNEEYGSVSQVTEMLFLKETAADYALSAPYENTPGDTWSYSSGTTNIINRLIKNTFDNEEAYLNFPNAAIFDKLDMPTAQIETDESNEYVLSSFMYASAREWGKLGQLYLNEGIWLNDTIITKEWHDYSLTPTPYSEDKYGAHIWLNGNPKEYPSCPDDTYKFSGYEGQYVIVIPSLELIIVRLGLSKGPPFDMDKVLGMIIDAVG